MHHSPVRHNILFLHMSPHMVNDNKAHLNSEKCRCKHSHTPECHLRTPHKPHRGGMMFTFGIMFPVPSKHMPLYWLEQKRLNLPVGLVRLCLFKNINMNNRAWWAHSAWGSLPVRSRTMIYSIAFWKHERQTASSCTLYCTQNHAQVYVGINHSCMSII